ncbi:MAG: type II secretion system protein GspM [Pseudomonadota bacterium]
MTRHSGIIAWALVAAAVLALLSAVVLPLGQAHGNYDERIDRGYAQLARLRAIAGSREHVEALAAQLDSREMSRYIFEASEGGGEAPGLALRKVVDRMASGAGVSMSSVDDLRPEEQDSLVRVAVQVRAQSEPSDLVELIERIEAHRPLLFIENLGIRPHGSSRRRRRNNEQPAAQQLNIDLRLYAYFAEAGA